MAKAVSLLLVSVQVRSMRLVDAAERKIVVDELQDRAAGAGGGGREGDLNGSRRARRQGCLPAVGGDGELTHRAALDRDAAEGEGQPARVRDPQRLRRALRAH